MELEILPAYFAVYFTCLTMHLKVPWSESEMLQRRQHVEHSQST